VYTKEPNEERPGTVVIYAVAVIAIVLNIAGLFPSFVLVCSINFL
jgi:FlaG/FlaF family flagellin (archaellin)